ncbi:MAG: cell envelope integrity protein CreD [Chitinophagaceae bacterium]|nr:cell envelope integrity protein CreD [Chitinophagaceae bacterium]
MDNPIPQQPGQTPGLIQRNKNLIKGFMISFLILALLIPTFFITDLIRERQYRNEEVKKEISAQWGNEQTLSGPVLVIPYLQPEKSDDGKISKNKRHAFFLPDVLNVTGSLTPEYRARSTIFKLIVYTSNLKLNGSFNQIPFTKLGIPLEDLLLSEAFMVYSISDYTGIQQQLKLDWDGKYYDYNPGGNSVSIFEKNLHTLLPLNAEDLSKPHTFSMNIQLRGSERIQFTPVGKSTEVNINAKWPYPDFEGKTLPKYTIQDSSFQAGWKAFDLNREFPQQWKESQEIKLSGSDFGVHLIQPLDNYAKTSRTVKYAILVIMLTFVIYFFIEVFQKKNVHAVQYVLIGFALCIFYTLLLSISEYTSYPFAYISSAAATILLITLYTRSVFGSNQTAGIFGAFLTLLYVFIYILIQLQDGALLTGSIGLFIILSAIMYFSRKIDWNGSSTPVRK